MDNGELPRKVVKGIAKTITISLLYPVATASVLCNKLPRVKAPGKLEQFIPIWGSSRQAINDFQEGRDIWGTVNSAFAVIDVLSITSLARLFVAEAFRNAEWKAVRNAIGKAGAVESQQQIHHWVVPRNGWGKSVPNWVKNNPLNLVPMPVGESGAAIHTAIHTGGPIGWGARFIYSPPWVKNLVLRGFKWYHNLGEKPDSVSI